MTELSRRQFFRLGTDDEAPTTRHLLRPPGAIAEEVFLAACTRCDDCARACPHAAIKLAGPSAGKAEKTPVLHPEISPCRWCADMPCITACKTGALIRIGGSPPTRIATAVLDRSACLISEGILCDDCAVTCPSSVRAIRMMQGRLPLLDQSRCVGCGLCIRHCPAEPKAIRIVPATAKKRD